MLTKIFIVEDTPTDLNELIDFLKLIGIRTEQIEVINDINNAFKDIEEKVEENKKYIAFIDILWRGKEIGISLAKAIKKKLTSVKTIAYTKVGADREIKDIEDNFNALLDKTTTNPHQKAIVINDLEWEFIEEVLESEGFVYKFGKISEDNLHNEENMNNYFFRTVTSEKCVGQFLIADFSNFSVKDDDQQIERFKILQDSICNISEDVKYNGLKIIFLPTGDGVAVGILNENTRAFILELAFDLLEILRDSRLDNELRIGIHYGSVYHVIGEKDESQIIGPGINMTARVESSGKPGMILVSEDYFNLLIRRSGDKFCRALTISDPVEYSVKKDIFTGRFISKGSIGSAT